MSLKHSEHTQPVGVFKRLFDFLLHFMQDETIILFLAGWGRACTAMTKYTTWAEGTAMKSLVPFSRRTLGYISLFNFYTGF